MIVELGTDTGTEKGMTGLVHKGQDETEGS